MIEPGVAGAQLSDISETQFAHEVGATSDEKLAEAMGSELRADILHGIFDRMQQHFESQRADGVDGAVAWDICGRHDGGCDRYQMVIRDGRCQIVEWDQEKPKVTLTLDAASFLKLVSGNARLGADAARQAKASRRHPLRAPPRRPVSHSPPVH